jgi:hypothetical protein
LASTERANRNALVVAVVTAVVMIAFQMAAKATRDALFLSSFDVSALPRMVMASAALSMVVALGAARWMTAVGPARLVPGAFAASAALLLVEWLLVAEFRGLVAVLLYLHYGGLGAVLISGFWSIVNERFDPRTAKRYVGKIAAGATVGGVIGGLLAERVAVLGSVESMLPILAALHFVCSGLLLGARRARARAEGRSGAPSGRESVRAGVSGLKTIVGMPYLRGLVALVLLVTMGEVLIDFVFKVRATGAFGDGERLLRFFALFYTGVSVLTVAVQAVGSRFALQRLGLTRTVALLPAGVGLGSLGALAVPGLPSATALRGTEAVLRNGLYRAGYELLFTPLAAEQKRSTKALVDVAVVRLGDMAGAAVVQVVLLAVGAFAVTTLLGMAAGVSLVAVSIALGLRGGYVRTLERSLLSRAVELDLQEVQDATTRTAMLQSIGSLGLTQVGRAQPTAEVEGSTPLATPTPREAAPAPTLDPLMRRILDLRSRDVARVRAALAAGPVTPALVPHVVPLLAWDDVVSEAMTALRGVAGEVAGQLVDRLVDRDEEFAVRRRLPLVLAASPTPRVVDGLFWGLQDQRFEVRYRCGRALSHLLEIHPKLAVDRQRTFAAVLQEVGVDKGVWRSHRLLDSMEDEEWSPVVDEVLRERASRSLEHVFTVLSLVLPRQPLKVAFRGLHTDDAMLRGTALEYLETALPEDIRVALWPFLEDTRAAAQRESRPTDEIISDLLQSNQSIVMNLEQAKKLRERERKARGDPQEE